MNTVRSAFMLYNHIYALDRYRQYVSGIKAYRPVA
jgi:hypothetical protein